MNYEIIGLLCFGLYTFCMLVLGFFVGIRYHMRLMLEMLDNSLIELKPKEKNEA